MPTIKDSQTPLLKEGLLLNKMSMNLGHIRFISVEINHIFSKYFLRNMKLII